MSLIFERYTERARQAIVLAQEEARCLKHNYIGTEHLLLGLLREEEGLAARVLESANITVEEVRAQVARIVGQGDEVTTGQAPFTPRAKKVLELALREALSLGHNYIGTEHILLGLVRENEGVAARILLDFDADADKIRNEIIRIMMPKSPVSLVVKEPVVKLLFSDKDQQKRLVNLSFDPTPKEPTNGKLNEATVVVIEQTMYDTNAQIRELKSEIAKQEDDLTARRSRLESAEQTMSALAESVGCEWDDDMYKRVLNRARR